MAHEKHVKLRPEWMDWRIPGSSPTDSIFRIFRYRSARGWHVTGATADSWLFGPYSSLDLEADPQTGTVVVRDHGETRNLLTPLATTTMPDTLKELQAWCRLVAGCVGRPS